MTRVSLKEAYDNKDVVAQIYAIRDIAEGAEDTADSAVTTANTASDHVDALVPQVEGAVQNANNASASAQASAQTVAGYENRLSAVEGETAGLDSDLGAVELRVTTAEGQIVTIQGRVTALETADGQNVKLTGTQNITGIKTVPLETTGTASGQIASSQKVKNELDNYSPMVRDTGNKVIDGFKSFKSAVTMPLGTRTAQDVPSLILTLNVSASNAYQFDFAISNKRSLNIGRLNVWIGSAGTVGSVTWTAGSATGTARCNLGAFTVEGVLNVTISGTEGGSYNAVSILGAFGGDGYPMSPTFHPRTSVTPSEDYKEVLVS